MAVVPQAKAGNGGPDYPNPYLDAPSTWTVFWAGGWNWRWFSSPNIYFRPGLKYKKREVTIIDGLGREKKFDRPFDCFIDPLTGKIETLYVQAPYSICRASATHPNATWKRNLIVNATPLPLRVANIPFSFIPRDRRGDRSKYTAEDWLSVIALWIPAVTLFLLLTITVDDTMPAGKEQTRYLPMMYRGLRYPRLARNKLENRESVIKELGDYNSSSNGNAAISPYRKLRPRFLNYLVETDGDGTEKNYMPELRPVTPDDFTSFVMVCYSSAHYDVDRSQEDFDELLAVATMAAVRHFEPLPPNLRDEPRAFWIAANCIPPDKIADANGNILFLEDDHEKETLANNDTYSISDIVRAAECVIIVAGNPRRPWDDEALKVWGERVWTLPEVILSRGDYVTVCHCGDKGERGGETFDVFEISKAQFPNRAWRDSMTSRQLIEHFTSLPLSRLERVKIALECLMNRELKELHPGDRVYALMGLLRIRPPINTTDSSFQAFARLSLPQDSDRLMERLICLLPNSPDESWELMTDQYQASLWDIYPDTQVCGIGENDTVIVDGAKGAQIDWSGFKPVRSLRQLTLKRTILFFILRYSPSMFFTGIGLVVTYRAIPPLYKFGIALICISLILFILPSPYFLWHFYAGKFWAVEPYFFGIEGYVPLEVIEERLFGSIGGKDGGRLKWSAYGSPLSRHTQGEAWKERVLRPVGTPKQRQEQSNPPLPPLPTEIDTYPINAIDPTSPCSSCRDLSPQEAKYCRNHLTVAKCQDISLRGKPGELKLFTLVDTLNLTVTLFEAVRPPTMLVVAGSEGGMKRAIACSFDINTGTLYRETVLRLPSQCADRMEGLPRIRLGLHRPFDASEIAPVPSLGPGHRLPGPDFEFPDWWWNDQR